MSDKRKVHDILSETGEVNGVKFQRRPVAFIQHGNPEDGFTYEGICPWCGETLGYIPAEQTKVIGGLYRILLHLQKTHWLGCEKCPKQFDPNSKIEFAVEITTVPLNVEKPFKLQ